jgi:hypothetical protein
MSAWHMLRQGCLGWLVTCVAAASATDGGPPVPDPALAQAAPVAEPAFPPIPAQPAPGTCYVIPYPFQKAIEMGVLYGSPDEWSPPPVCRAAFVQLNAHCDRPIDPDQPIPPGGGISYPDWQVLDPNEHLDVLRALVDLEWREEQRQQNWATVQRHLPGGGGEPPISLATVDLDVHNAGRPERLYRIYHWPIWYPPTERPDLIRWENVQRYLASTREERKKSFDIFLGRVPFYFLDRTFFASGDDAEIRLIEPNPDPDPESISQFRDVCNLCRPSGKDCGVTYHD